MENGFKLRNNLFFLAIEAPGGIYNSEQMLKISKITDEHSAIIKIIEDQRLGIFIKEENIKEVSRDLLSIGLKLRNYQTDPSQPVSCIGNLCPDFKQDALGSAIKITESISKSSSKIKVGINGCEKCCVPCHTLDLSITGEEKGYRISIGGKKNLFPELASFVAENVPESELPETVIQIISEYENLANDGETLYELIERVGISPFTKILHPYSSDAVTDSDGIFQNIETEEPDDLKTEDINAPTEGKNMTSIDSNEHAETSEEESLKIDDLDSMNFDDMYSSEEDSNGTNQDYKEQETDLKENDLSAEELDGFDLDSMNQEEVILNEDINVNADFSKDNKPEALDLEVDPLLLTEESIEESLFDDESEEILEENNSSKLNEAQNGTIIAKQNDLALEGEDENEDEEIENFDELEATKKNETNEEAEDWIEKKISQDIDNSVLISDKDTNKTHRNETIRKLSEQKHFENKEISEKEKSIFGKQNSEDFYTDENTGSEKSNILDELHLESIHSNPNGSFIFTFYSGLSIELNPSILSGGNRTIQLGSSSLSIGILNGQPFIEIEEGLKMFLPNPAA